MLYKFLLKKKATLALEFCPSSLTFMLFGLFLKLVTNFIFITFIIYIFTYYYKNSEEFEEHEHFFDSWCKYSVILHTGFEPYITDAKISDSWGFFYHKELEDSKAAQNLAERVGRQALLDNDLKLETMPSRFKKTINAYCAAVIKVYAAAYDYKENPLKKKKKIFLLAKANASKATLKFNWQLEKIVSSRDRVSSGR